MTPERYRRVKAILNEVLDTPLPGRARVVERHCSTDSELESEVRRVLAQIESVGALDRPPLDSDGIEAALAAREDAVHTGDLLCGRFRLVRLLGQGGMGQVWEAFDQQLQESVALKKIRGSVLDRAAVSRLKREVLNARRVTHPNVCRVYDFFVHDDGGEPIPFFTMQLLKGETLWARIVREGRLPEAEAEAVLRDCAAGLAAAHSAGLVHGDFKPGNVMLVPGGPGGVRAVITDFGVARSSHSSGPAHTTTPLAGGTAAYMAPAQDAVGPPLPASDVWAFGVVACEVLTGKRPAEGGLAAVPRTWRRPIRRSLHPDPARRGSFPLPTGLWRSRYFAAGIVLLVGLLALMLVRWGNRPERPTIAVAPFTAEPGDSGGAVLGEALAEEITASISRIPGLLVLAQTSVRSGPDPLETARRMDARYLVRGHIRRDGANLRFTVELLNPASRTVLWMENFTRPRAQIPALHMAIVHEVASRLGTQPASLAQMGAFGTRTPAFDTVEVFERGRRLGRDRTRQNLQSALDCFDDAIARDPQFALAYAARASTLAIMAEHSFADPAEAFPKAKEAALQAMTLDPQLAEAHAALGLIQSLGDWDLYNSEKSLEHAVQLAPGSVSAHQWYAQVLLKLGKPDEAIREAKMAARLDPLSPAPAAAAAWMYYYGGRYSEGLVACDDLGRKHPDFPYMCVIRGEMLHGLRAFVEASQSLRQCSPALHDAPVYLRAYGVTEAALGHRSEAMAAISRLLENPATRPGSAPHIAAIYAALGMSDEAFRWLDQGLLHRDPLTAFTPLLPAFTPIRADPRYALFLARIGVTQRK
jgi:eukaryotic-like serine/threonine-protein kinase